MKKTTYWQTFQVKGHEIVEKVKEIVAEGNVRRVRIRQHDRTIAEFPLTAGVVGVVLAPVVAALGALAALLNECTIDVERTAAAEPPQPVAAGDVRMDEQC